jgi:hypothetical protein
MREALRQYKGRAVGALQPLTTRARSLRERLDPRALASARGLWRDRVRLLRQGGGWLRQHKVTFSVALAVVVLLWLVVWLVARINWPDRVLTWRFWTRRPEDVRNLLLVSLGALAAALTLALGVVRTHAANLQARVAAQAHITDRFTKAVELRTGTRKGPPPKERPIASRAQDNERQSQPRPPAGGSGS